MARPTDEERADRWADGFREEGLPDNDIEITPDAPVLDRNDEIDADYEKTKAELATKDEIDWDEGHWAVYFENCIGHD